MALPIRSAKTGLLPTHRILKAREVMGRDAAKQPERLRAGLISHEETAVPKRLTVIPERCSGCRLCEVVCALHHFGVNNPKKAAIRVVSLYPHPVIRMPVVCRQCAQPKCRENCPTDAISVDNGVVRIDAELCVSCQQCVISCPFGAIFVHDDIPIPFKCDLCGGRPQCVQQCPKGALQYVPEHELGEASRVAAALRYAHMKEVEYVEEGERKKLRYAEIGREQKRETEA